MCILNILFELYHKLLLRFQ